MGKDKPILFSGQMVRALLTDNKYSTMRIMRRQPPEGETLVPDTVHPTKIDSRGNEYPGTPCFGARTEDGRWCIRSPFESGDRLWVKETWGINHKDYIHPPHPIPKARPREVIGVDMVYFATENDVEIQSEMPKTPSLFMPRWASRITLPVATVYPKRVQDLTMGEICREGLARNIYEFTPVTQAFKAWEDLWVSLNGRASWDANPWCWMITFAVIKENIDAAG